ncbi:hypothetical protein EI555_001954 [Monodon monoceros]|uniref:G-protein coupled receptors family 1 profile domain-containing protein n=1 Tax=Monodon monoceros TaxID=40151 RepID=A0A4U1FF99_MONMO|nr:hypothetical protein EI555_001954 [Monodon monoceros]
MNSVVNGEMSLFSAYSDQDLHYRKQLCSIGPLSPTESYIPNCNHVGLSTYSNEKLDSGEGIRVNIYPPAGPVLSLLRLSPDDLPSMEWVNETLVREFVFLGFSSLAGLHQLLFVVFLLIYMFTLGTNAIIISTIVLDRALHTPMYFFLARLSCSETCYTFVIVPKMLVDLLAQKKTISFLGCSIQMFSFLFLGCSHSFLLAAMGYDRYVAICNPLRDTVLMGHGMCVGLVAVACLCGFTIAEIITSLVFHLPFHSSNQLHHIFCDISPVLTVVSLSLSCSVHWSWLSPCY